MRGLEDSGLGFRRHVASVEDAAGGAGSALLARPASTRSAGEGWFPGKREWHQAAPLFVWTVSEGAVDWQAVSGDQCVNHFMASSQLTTKAGLVSTMRDMHWWVKADQSAFFPRSYILSDAGDRRAFAVDFRRCAAAAVLRLHLTFVDMGLGDDVVCAPRLVAAALRAVASWARDLERHVGSACVDDGELDGARAEDPAVDTEGFDSDGVSGAEWAELLRYQAFLLPVADAAEAEALSGDGGPRWPAVCAAAAEFRGQVQDQAAGAPVQPAASGKRGGGSAAVAFRPSSRGIPSLDDMAKTQPAYSLQPSAAAAAAADVKRRHLWADSVPFSSMQLPAEGEGCRAPGVIGCASRMLAVVAALWPQAGIDALIGSGRALQRALPRNTWVVKAPSSSRGAGIAISRSLSSILAKSGGMGGRVVQKYIETPLLSPVHQPVQRGDALPAALPFGVKFDLRLWVLLIGPARSPGAQSRDRPPQCFVFEPCYARRCSRKFTLSGESLKVSPVCCCDFVPRGHLECRLVGSPGTSLQLLGAEEGRRP